MDVLEAHRLAFLIGYKMIDKLDPDNDEKLLGLLKSLRAYTGNDGFVLDKSVLASRPYSVIQVFQKWGQSTLAQMINSGFHWSILASRARLLHLPESERKPLLKDQGLKPIYESLDTFLHSNMTHFVLNYFFDFPVKDMITIIFLKISDQIRQSSDLENLNPHNIAKELFIAVHTAVSLIESGVIVEPERIRAHIDERTLIRSRVKAFLYEIPLLLLIPPLLLLGMALMNMEFTVDDIVVALVTFSGTFSVLGVGAKLFYDNLVPHMQRRVLLNDLRALGTEKIFLQVYGISKKKDSSTDEALKHADSASSYPISKYILTSRNIDPWKEYVSSYVKKFVN